MKGTLGRWPFSGVPGQVVFETHAFMTGALGEGMPDGGFSG